MHEGRDSARVPKRKRTCFRANAAAQQETDLWSVNLSLEYHHSLHTGSEPSPPCQNQVNNSKLLKFYPPLLASFPPLTCLHLMFVSLGASLLTAQYFLPPPPFKLRMHGCAPPVRGRPQKKKKKKSICVLISEEPCFFSPRRLCFSTLLSRDSFLME